MGDEETVEGRKLEKRIKLKSKQSKTMEAGGVMHEIEHTGGVKEIEHSQASDKDETVVSKIRKRKNKEKKKHKKVEGFDNVDLEKNDSIKGELSGLNGKDSTIDSVNNVERKRKKKKSKKNNGVGDSGVHGVEDTCQDREIEHSEAFEKVEIVEKEENKKVKGVESVNLEGNYNDETKLICLNDNDSTSVPVTNVERKKKKNKSKDKNRAGHNPNGKDNVEDAINSAQHKKEKNQVKNKNGDGNNENGSENVQHDTDANGEDSVGNTMSDLEQKNKKISKINNENEAGDKSNGKDSNGDTINYVEQKKKKKKKRVNHSDVGIAEEVDVSKVQESLAEESVSEKNSKKKSEAKMKEIPNDVTENVEKKKKKKKRKRAEENKKARSNKKVRFSSEVEVFNLPPKSSNNEEDKDKMYRWNNKGDDLIRGKRFSKEEDEIVKDAVLQYIELRNLGEDGLDMVLNSMSHKELIGCWNEIATCIPYRPKSSVYGRAQVLFKRSNKRKWTEEEFEIIRNYQKEHGNKWTELAEELGTHHWHVKDAWRRIRLRNQNKGSWSQQEYQRLFDLVNMDLQLKVSQSEEKNSKYGMLRDNIAWTAISDRVETRNESICCMKWYNQLTSPMVSQGVWADADDYYMIGKLYSLDATCIEDVDWDELLESRSGDLCRKRWDQMALHMGQNKLKSFSEQVEVLAKRYCPHLFEVREEWDNKPRVV